jgi:hypothetical protein
MHVVLERRGLGQSFVRSIGRSSTRCPGCPGRLDMSNWDREPVRDRGAESAPVRGIVLPPRDAVVTLMTLLRKSIPDLAAAEIKSEQTHRYVVEVPPVLDRNEWQRKYGIAALMDNET